MPKVIGIDLGTTTSCVAVIEGGVPVIIPNSEGWRTTPSIVAFDKNGQFLVGEAAKRQAILNSKNTLFSIKRLIGRKYDDPEIDRDCRLLPYKVVRASNGDAWIEVWGRPYCPQEISALILQKLKTDAEAYLGELVKQAVITVPAYFDNAQRQATRDAGQIAGFEVLRIINEPTAASLAYGLDGKKDRTVLVYDLGGGSFDVSVLQLGDGVFEVKSTSGNTHLGGDQTRMPAVRGYVRRLLEREPGLTMNPDEAVAIGAAIQAGVLTGDLKDVLLLDVVPLSLGIEVKGTSFTPLIQRNTTIPTQSTQVFSTSQDNQSAIDIKVLQGESKLSTENCVLGSLTLDGVPPAPCGVPQIEVTFDIDANAILNVSARDKGSGREQKITIVSSSGLSKSQIERMMRNVEIQADKEKRRKAEAEERNMADSACHGAEQRIAELAEKLTVVLQAKVDNLRSALTSNDIDRLRVARETLEQTFQRIDEELLR